MSMRFLKRGSLAVGVLAVVLSVASLAWGQWPMPKPNQPQNPPGAQRPPQAPNQPQSPPPGQGLYREERFIVHLYRGYLNRQPSPEDVRIWSDRMGRGTSPGELVRAFMESDEYFVRQCYLGLLRREPDPGGMNTYLQQLRGGWARANVVESLINSDEFRRQLGGGGGPRPY